MKPAKVAYRRCLVSFFDILGFRGLIADKGPDEILSLMKLFQRTGKIADETVDAFEARSFQFSDCIVRMMPLDSEANQQSPVGILFHEIIAIVHAALEMANRGIFLRGGLTIGDGYFSETTMFGPAMVRAYELESRVAIYPRVIVDPIVVEALKHEPLLKKDTHDISDEVTHLLRLLQRGADGIWFVDFLHAALDEVDDPSLYGSLLDEHKRSVKNALKGCKKLDDVAIKVLWAAHYHNQVLDRLLRDGADRKSIDRHRIAIPPKLLGELKP